MTCYLTLSFKCVNLILGSAIGGNIILMRITVNQLRKPTPVK